MEFAFCKDPSGIILNMNLLERKIVIKGGRGFPSFRLSTILSHSEICPEGSFI